jgi:hypothetical protein
VVHSQFQYLMLASVNLFTGVTTLNLVKDTFGFNKFSRNATSIVADGGVVYAALEGTSYLGQPIGEVVAINAATSAIQWSYSFNNATFSPLAVGPTFCAAIIYHRGNTSTGLLVVFDTEATALQPLRFIADLPQYLGPAPPVLGADGVIYASTSDGTLYAVNSATGAIVATGAAIVRAGFSVTALAVAPGQLLVSLSSSAGTYVVAVGTAPPPPPPPAAAAAPLPAAAVASISVAATAAVAAAAVRALVKAGVLRVGGGTGGRGDGAPLLDKA